MKITIKYHRNGDRGIENVTTVEADTIHTREIKIGGVSFMNGIVMYMSTKPARIDRQGNSVFIIGQKWASRHPEPTQLYDNTKLFGEPVTVC